jgi:hypothetical protein
MNVKHTTATKWHVKEKNVTYCGPGILTDRGRRYKKFAIKILRRLL